MEDGIGGFFIGFIIMFVIAIFAVHVTKHKTLDCMEEFENKTLCHLLIG